MKKIFTGVLDMGTALLKCKTPGLSAKIKIKVLKFYF